jgi:hypothetical protein
MTNKKRFSLDELKACSDIFHNFASPLATVAAAAVAVIGAAKVAETIIEARGEGSTAFAQPATGIATGNANAAGAGVTVSPPSDN